MSLPLHLTKFKKQVKVRSKGRYGSRRLKPAHSSACEPHAGDSRSLTEGGAALTHRLFQKPDVCIKSPAQLSWGEEYRTAEG